ncbi:glycosyltransferase [Arthrobacter oryzae]|uniref:glycosyltransferase n=1 Tax=Arthrobacter oryzae TaxID=409290 RepID=UPI0030C9105C
MKPEKQTDVSKSVAIIGTRGYPSYYGGFETAVRKLAPYLVDSDWDVTVYGRTGATKEDDAARDMRVRSVMTAGLESKSLSTLTFGLTSVIHALVHKPDVALVMNVANGFWLPLLRLRGIPTVVNVDGIEWERAKWGRLAKSVFKLGAKFTARFGNVLVSDSLEIGRRWQEDFSRDSIFIPYGGDEPSLLPVVQGLEHGKYVLLVARFVPENTVNEFFEAAEKLATEFPVVVVGSTGYGGELDDKARQLAARYANFTWLGHLSDDQQLLSLWQHAGVYFHGHSVGGTNPALVQAMACGAPVLARRTQYNLEVLASEANMVDPAPDEIVAAIQALMANPDERAAAGRQNKSRAAAHYSWRDVCAAYELAISTSAVAASRGSNADPQRVSRGSDAVRE